jgi:hypothetical protein
VSGAVTIVMWGPSGWLDDDSEGHTSTCHCAEAGCAPLAAFWQSLASATARTTCDTSCL